MKNSYNSCNSCKKIIPVIPVIPVKNSSYNSCKNNSGRNDQDCSSVWVSI
jgi:hypothetical protein